MSTTIAPEAEQSVRFPEELFDGGPPADIAFRLWDGTLSPTESPRAATIVLNHPGAPREMFGPVTEKRHRGHLAIYQALLSKPVSDGCAHRPLTRRDWYETA